MDWEQYTIRMPNKDGDDRSNDQGATAHSGKGAEVT